MKKITVLIPCYNEADAIQTVIKKIPKDKLRKAGYNVDILVIDNNSSDNTAELASQAGARVVFEGKQGKGNGILTGFYNIASDADYVVMLDGDDTYNPEEMLRLIEPLDSGFASVIIGSRMHGQMKSGSMKSFNHFGNRLYSRLVRMSYKVMVSDTLTGYVAWKREAIEKLRPHLKSAGFTIEMEMVTKLARLGYEIYSVPVSYDSRLGSSSLRPIRDGARIMGTYGRHLGWVPDREKQLRRKLNLKSSSIKIKHLGETEKINEANENSLSI
jgi:glycosyltransferase involved in cell wall biosynthesis